MLSKQKLFNDTQNQAQLYFTFIILYYTMRGPSFKFVEVAESNNALAERVDKQNPKKIYDAVQGQLHFLVEVSSGMLLLQLHPFMYGINPNDQIVYEDNDPNYKLILCLNNQTNQCWIVKLNQNHELLLEILGQRCKLIQRNAANVLSSKLRYPNADEDPNDRVKEEQFRKELNNQSNQSSENLLIVASKTLGEGLRYTGNIFSRGFQSLGKYFSNKIEPSQALVLSDRTKNMIDKSNSGSKKILQFTEEQFANIFHMGMKQVTKITDRGSQGGKMDKLKGTIKTGLHIVFNVYDGYTDGVSDAIHGLGKGSKQVVNAKYGSEAAQASYKIVEGSRNIYKVTKVPTTQVKKYFNPNIPPQQKKK